MIIMRTYNYHGKQTLNFAFSGKPLIACTGFAGMTETFFLAVAFIAIEFPFPIYFFRRVMI